MKIILVAIFAFLVFAQCPNQNADKELALKEKELELKAKELELKEKAKDDEDDDKAKEKPEEKPAPAPEKKAEPVKKTEPVGSNGCSVTNRVRFKKGSSAQTFKCDLATNSGNTKHRYTLDAEAGQDLTVTFKSTDTNYSITDPQGGRVDNLKFNREQFALTKDGTWTVSVNLDSGSSFGDYTINFEIK